MTKAQKLRQKAAELQRRADELEKARAERIGRLMIRLEERGFEGVTIDDLRQQIAKIR